MIAEKIKELRTKQKLTQSEIAKRLGITRSSVNAWEMGISVPSTKYIIELSLLFNVSSDYLLNIHRTSVINIQGLSDREVSAIQEIIECLKKSKQIR